MSDMVQELAQLGAHLGHKKSKSHPKMAPFVFGVRNNIQLINLEKTDEYLKKARDFVKESLEKKSVILLVGTKPQFKKIITDAANKIDMPYVSERWLGGTLTNFPVISKRIEYFLDLQKKLHSGELAKYTKKEQLIFEREIKDLEKKLGGIKSLKKIPDAIFIANIEHESTALREALRKNIAVIATVDTNTDPTKITYPIPVNDDNPKVLKYILDKLFNLTD